jgi:hypothetical protein
LHILKVIISIDKDLTPAEMIIRLRTGSLLIGHKWLNITLFKATFYAGTVPEEQRATAVYSAST